MLNLGPNNTRFHDDDGIGCIGMLSHHASNQRQACTREEKSAIRTFTRRGHSHTLTECAGFRLKPYALAVDLVFPIID